MDWPRLFGMPLSDFLEGIYERQRLHVRGRPEGFASLFSLEVLEQLLWQQEAGLAGMLAVHRQGEKLHPPGASSLGSWAADCFQQGGTLILNDIGRFHLPVARFQRALAEALESTVRTNVYLTPAQSRGNDAHFDTHDVLILQVEGCKRWSLYESANVLLPTLQQRRQLDRTQLGPETVLQLEPGDLLYLPRGHVHEARAQEQTSLHLTFGLHPVLLVDLLKEALEIASDSNLELRRSLRSRAGTQAVREALRGALEEALGQLDEAASRLRQRRIVGMQPLPGGRLTSPPPLEAEQLVEHQPGVLFHVSRFQQTVGLSFPGLGPPGTSGMPPALDSDASWEPEFHFIARSRQPFSARSLPSTHPEEERLLLLDALVRYGVLRLTPS